MSKRKFREEWLEDDRLKDWITVSEVQSSCIYCNIGLNGAINNMVRHSTSKRHIDSTYNTVSTRNIHL